MCNNFQLIMKAERIRRLNKEISQGPFKHSAKQRRIHLSQKRPSG